MGKIKITNYILKQVIVDWQNGWLSNLFNWLTDHFVLIEYNISLIS